MLLLMITVDGCVGGGSGPLFVSLFLYFSLGSVGHLSLFINTLARLLAVNYVNCNGNDPGEHLIALLDTRAAARCLHKTATLAHLSTGRH